VKNPTLAEFRSEAAKGEFPHAFSEETALWKYLLSPETVSPLGGTVPLLDPEEHRVLSKASGPVGGYLVDQSFDDRITAARRARAIIGAVASSRGRT
jgi:hypothetical protein